MVDVSVCVRFSYICICIFFLWVIISYANDNYLILSFRLDCWIIIPVMEDFCLCFHGKDIRWSVLPILRDRYVEKSTSL